MLRCLALLLLLVSLSNPVMAADARNIITSFSYDGCVDAAGKPVPAQADNSLQRFAEARLEADKLVIYYNPLALPELLPETRLFLFAQECARFPLKQPLQAERSSEQLQKADCWALATVSRSRPQGAGKLSDALMVDLPADESLWQRIGTPAHELDFARCSGRDARGSLALPGEGQHSDKWNLCVQSCGAKLYSCGRSASCQSSYNACSASCEGK